MEPLTVEQQLKQKQSEILYARKKAEEHTKRAAKWHAIADAKVKEAAALGTGSLPLMENVKPHPDLWKALTGRKR